MSKQSQIREQVTAKIVAALETRPSALATDVEWQQRRNALQCPDRKTLSRCEYPPAWAPRCRARLPIERLGNLQPVETDGLLRQSSA